MSKKTGGIILVVLGVLSLPVGLIFLVPGVLILRSLKKTATQREEDTPPLERSSGPAPHGNLSPCHSAPVPSPQDPAPLLMQIDPDGSIGVTFGSWDVSIHGSDGQDLRFDRAQFQNLVIQSYDASTGVAEILGSRGILYKTTLDSCTCDDFQRRGLPCKHIYKLALSMGYTMDAFFAARSDVVWYADGCRVYHADPNCRGLKNRLSRRSTVSMAEYSGLHPCKSCCGKN